MSTFLSILRSFGLLIARLGVGGILILHGWNRWQHLGIASQAEYLSQFNTPYPTAVAWASTIFEVVGGVFLIVGALTPLIGLGLLVEQALIISYTSYWKNWNLLNPDGSYNGGFEYNVALGLLGLLFLVLGGGGVAVDRLFKRSKSEDDADETSQTRATTSV